MASQRGSSPGRHAGCARPQLRQRRSPARNDCARRCQPRSRNISISEDRRRAASQAARHPHREGGARGESSAAIRKGGENTSDCGSAICGCPAKTCRPEGRAPLMQRGREHLELRLEMRLGIPWHRDRAGKPGKGERQPAEGDDGSCLPDRPGCGPLPVPAGALPVRAVGHALGERAITASMSISWPPGRAWRRDSAHCARSAARRRAVKRRHPAPPRAAP